MEHVSLCLSFYNLEENILYVMTSFGSQKTLRHNGGHAGSLEQRVKDYAERQPWVQDIELPGGIRTRPDLGGLEKNMWGKWKRLEPVVDALGLKNKRVLDVGCNEGFFSIEAAKRGAQVHGVDLDPIRIEKARFVAEALGRQDVRFDVIDVYGDEFSALGRFDVAFLIGMVHRLPDPMRALQQVSQLADILVIEWKTIHRGPQHQPLAYYVPGANEDGEILHPRHWLVSPACLRGMLKDLGYSRFRRIDDERTRRAVLIAGRSDHPVFKQQADDIVRKSRLMRVKRATQDYLAALRDVATTR